MPQVMPKPGIALWQNILWNAYRQWSKINGRPDSNRPEAPAAMAIPLFEPLSLWSLWVPLFLLSLILLAAIYFMRASSSR